MPVTEKFKKGQHVWYYYSEFMEPRELVYDSLPWGGWMNRCKTLTIDGENDGSRDLDFLFATELEALRTKGKWLEEELRGLDTTYKEIKARKLELSIALCEVGIKIADSKPSN